MEDCMSKLADELRIAAIQMGEDINLHRTIADWQRILARTVHYSGIVEPARIISESGPTPSGADSFGEYSFDAFVSALEYAMHHTHYMAVRHDFQTLVNADGSRTSTPIDSFIYSLAPEQYAKAFSREYIPPPPMEE